MLESPFGGVSVWIRSSSSSSYQNCANDFFIQRDCSDSLVDAGFINPATIPFKNDGNTVSIADNISVIFTH